MTHEEFMHAMLRPTFVHRMATGMRSSSSEGQRRGAEDRMTSAQRDIDQLVLARAETIQREQLVERGEMLS